MIRKLLIFTIGLALFVSMPDGVVAQGDPQQNREQLRYELQRTDDLIAQARMAVQSSGNALAARALEQAEQLQSGARRAFDGGTYLLCISLTRKAREQASLAISISRQAEQLEGVLQGRLERAHDNLERVRDELPTPLNPTMSTLVDQARYYLAQAWEFYRQGRFLACAKLVEQVEQTIRRLASLAQLGEQAGESFQYRLENVQRLLEYAREQVADCDSEAGREFLGQAERSLGQARDFHAQNQIRAALTALGHARESARKAARECQSGDRLRLRHDRLNSELDRLWEQLRAAGPGAGSTAAEELLRQASEQLRLAGQHLAEDRIESAQLSLQAAQIALRQAQRYLSGER
ncbi:MAG: hypothetical protein AB1772_10485 [Candidatus Zixiibacteriota bacterium]